MAVTEQYPVTLAIDYPDRPLNRLTSFFRIFTAIPIVIVLCLILAWAPDWGNWTSLYGAAGAGILFFPLVLMILFRQKYPRWWFDWNLAFARFGARVFNYLSLLTDVYPSTDEEQGVHLQITYPDVPKELSRGLPLVKWFLAIPHYVVLFFLGIGACVSVIIAWFAILFTGRFPRGLFDYVVGYYRWSLRVTAYAFILTTDKYPAFDLN
jgi:hypothetical protein